MAEITIELSSNTIEIDLSSSSSAAQGYAAAAAADAALTAADVISTAADVASTNADVVSTNADVVSTNADAASTAADAISTAADAVSTAADAVSTAADAAAAAASAADAGLNWRDDWVTSTAYAVSDGVRSDGYGSYICTSAHTSGASTEPGVGGSWETVWDIFAADAEAGAAATDTVAGIVELATIAEVDTGTDTERAITPAGLAGSALASAVTANTAKTSNANHTGDVTGATALTIADEAVTLAKMANLANARIIGRNTAGSGVPEALTEAQFKALFNLEAGTDFEAVDADILRADTDDTLTAGFAATGSSDGTQSSGTYTPAAAGGNYKEIINGGSFTLAPMTLEGNVTIEMTNNGSAGTVTTSGFDIVTGDDLTTTDTHVFLLYLTVIDASSHLHITALQ